MRKLINNINDLIDFCRPFVSVPHETANKLQIYADTLMKWQKKINLVSPNTINQIWHRHMADTAQLMSLVSHENRILDIGSGAGFPGMVLAIMGCDVTMVEVDQRKCSFLSDVAMRCGINVTIKNKSIADFWGEESGNHYSHVTARALASVSDLLEYSYPALSSGSKCVFLKGEGVEEELTLAKQSWHIDYQVKPSLTDQRGFILMIEKAARRD